MMLYLGKKNKKKKYTYIKNYADNFLNSIGHACGHNIITVQGLACTLAFKELMDKGLVQGTVVLFGTPAEETTSGKINMVKDGLVQDNVDYAMMLVSVDFISFLFFVFLAAKFYIFFSILLLSMDYTVEC